ncbi:FAD:protein FMN transferase [Chloroflexota bacterium]
MKKFCSIITVLVGILVLLPMLASCSEKPKMVEETRSLMGTYVKVVVYADEDIALEAINTAYKRMEEVIDIVTTYEEQGEAFKLNQDGYIEGPSEELREVIETSIKYYTLTGGYFDITIQPLLDLWQFNPETETQFWELDESFQKVKIVEAKRLLGSLHIIIEENKISFDKEGMKVTLNAIAKGYIVDEALETIESMGIKYALVDAGGDIGTLGSKPKGELWRISLVNPDDTSESLLSLRIHDMSVTTSGNYERYFDPEKEVGHILDPKTGYSSDAAISVTIISKDCTQGDALATGVFVMGVEDGMTLIESLDNVECLIVDNDRNLHESSGLSEYLSER